MIQSVNILIGKDIMKETDVEPIQLVVVWKIHN